jgi:hypothetical protein
VASHPADAPPIEVSVDRITAVTELISMTSRHKLVRTFANRISNAFGKASDPTGWSCGTLHTPSGPTELIGTRGNIRSWRSGGSFWSVAVNGSVRQSQSTDHRVGWWLDGALLDPEGNLLATVEFPTIHGLPDDFSMIEVEPFAPEYIEDREPEPTSVQHGPATLPQHPPECSGRWADTDPIQHMHAR